MVRWRINRASLIVLGFVVFVMLVIVVLPDVDLLDTAFQRDTAPIAVHAQATSAPATVTVATVLQLPPYSLEIFRHFRGVQLLSVYSVPNFLPIVLGSLRR
jgi:hypothetical protein